MNNPFVPSSLGGGSSSTITGFTQTDIIYVSGLVAVPEGTKRIEALMVGGGGGGGPANNGGAGHGGIQIYEIPVLGAPLDIVVGAGGAPSTIGGTTSVSCRGTMYAAVGGGGSGGVSNGKFGGGGGSGPSGGNGGSGGAPFGRGLLFSPFEMLPSTGAAPGTQYITATATANVYMPPGGGGNIDAQTGGNPAMGYGGGAGYAIGASTHGGAGAGGFSTTSPAGGGAGGGCNGGPLTAMTIWGFTGFAGGALAGGGGGGGGGGLFGAGANAVGNNGGNGGLGGGGGGTSVSAGTSGTGGAGAVVLRFYY